ncbi:MAG: IPT/TIG domain-containing protein, partial [Thermoanaerobaculia bacterium]
MRAVAILTFIACLASSVHAEDDAYLVKDINQIAVQTGSFPSKFVTLGDVVVFDKCDSLGYPLALWRSDGSEAGTYRLGGIAYFKLAWKHRVWYAGERINELWSSDGTNPPQRQAVFGDSIHSIMATQSHLYVHAGTQLLRIDGPGLTPVKVNNAAIGGTYPPGVGDNRSWVALGDTLYFDGGHGAEHGLIRVDVNGTSLVRSAGPSSYFKGIAAAGDLVYARRFVAGEGAKEIWRSDGSPGGTVPLHPGAPIVVGDTLFVTVGSSLYFVGDDGSGAKLWRSDGTDEGTVAVAHGLPGVTATFEARPAGVLANGTIIFITFRWPLQELWAYDGAEVRLLSNALNYGNFNPRLAVASTYGVIGADRQLWRTDGTVAGTWNLGELDGSEGYVEWPMIGTGDVVFFGARGDDTGFELWKTGGSIASTSRVKDIGLYTEASEPHMLRAFRGGALFLASSDARYIGSSDETIDLWFSDGTEVGTTKLASDVLIHEMTQCGSRAFLSRSTVESGTELWVTDGTAMGTSMLLDIQPGSASGSPYPFTCVDNTLFFLASTVPSSRSLWRSDGTVAGTVEVARIATPADQYPEFTPLQVIGQTLYFGVEMNWKVSLWRSDGTAAGTGPLLQLEGANYFSGRPVLAVDRLYFVTSEDASRNALWTSDGTVPGTRKVMTGEYLSLYGAFGRAATMSWILEPYGSSSGLCLHDGAASTCFDSTPAYHFPDFTTRVLNGRLYYNLPELRTFDGVTAATTGVGDIEKFLETAAGRLYAARESADNSLSLVETDGTAGNTTRLLKGDVKEAKASGGRLFIAADELYAYDIPVAATSFAPHAVVGGGQPITITGRGFHAPVTVSVGGTAAPVGDVTSTSIAFIAPYREPGAYAVEVTLGDGRQLTLDEPLEYVCAPPAAVIESLPGVYAANEPVQLRGSGAARCAWFPGTGLDDPSSCSPRATLSIGQTYTLIVYDEAGCASTNHPKVRVRVTPPVPPSFAVFGWRGAAIMSWSASAGATSYELQRTDGAGVAVTIAVPLSTSTSDATVVAQAAYVYRIRAVGPDGASAGSKGDYMNTVTYT